MRTDQEIWDDIALSDTVLEDERGNYPLNYNTSLLLEVLLNNRQYLKQIYEKEVPPVIYNYVDRGDPANYDFTKDDLVADGAIHELDLSTIVPEEGAGQLVHLRIVVRATSANKWLILTEKGKQYSRNAAPFTTQGPNVSYNACGWVKLDENRKIQYLLDDSANWTYVYITVRGWFKAD